MILPLLLLQMALGRVRDGQGNTWAVLIAGSRTYMNYRHQSDVCHAYQILSKEGGIPDEHLIVLMTDDVANDDENPFQGNIINVPKGSNVYPGVLKDYTGNAVTKETFLNVIQGKSGANTTKVLKSTENDDVFIYYADHGATGLVAMPWGDPLYADELLEAIKYMHKNKMYRRLVIYVEACESGSMFAKLLPNNLNVYAVTASSPSEPSYACYWDQDRHTYLADAYSVNWLKDSEANLLKNETLAEQFKTVKKATVTSTVERYGSMGFVSDLVEFYQGQSGNYSKPIPKRKSPSCAMPVSSRDVRLESLKRRWQQEADETARKQLKKDIEAEDDRRWNIEYVFRTIVRYAVGENGDMFQKYLHMHAAPKDFDGMRKLHKTFEKHCALEWDEYSYKFFTILVSLNEKLGTDPTETAIHQACGSAYYQ